jgi:hypothetical protein
VSFAQLTLNYKYIYIFKDKLLDTLKKEVMTFVAPLKYEEGTSETLASPVQNHRGRGLHAAVSDESPCMEVIDRNATVSKSISTHFSVFCYLINLI